MALQIFKASISGILFWKDLWFEGFTAKSIAPAVVRLVCPMPLMRHGVDGFSPSSWEPQEEGMMSTVANFPSVRNQGLIVSRKKPNV
jgi:hypothetical protein